MQLYFNELSGRCQEADRHRAAQRMQGLLNLCKAARIEGFRALKTNRDFDGLELCDGYRVWDWYRDPAVSRTMREFFLAYRKFPFEDGDERVEDLFLQADYRLHEPDAQDCHGERTEGLAWAYVCQGLGVSFPVHAVWCKTEIRLEKCSDDGNEVVPVRHASQAEHLEIHRCWLESLRAPELVGTDVPPENKRIALRDDHGQDKLLDFSRRLVQSPYVVAVVNSLPYNPAAGNFIRRVHPDGKIELVLVWTDAGLGLVVQSTGRNLRETQAIAEILKDQFL
jgi:hypothetical protein